MIIESPGTVISNSLEQTIHLFNPKINYLKPKEVRFVVGTQINGSPHIGTYLTQAFSFVMAKALKEYYDVNTSVIFKALDNAPYDIRVIDDIKYQRTYYHTLGAEELKKVIHEYYDTYFQKLSKMLGIPYEIQTYTSDQQEPIFRENFIYSLNHYEKLRWILAPSNGLMKVRFPCPKCGYSDKKGINTKLLYQDDQKAIFESYCFEHGVYEVEINSYNKEVYFDLNTLYRNLVKEVCYAQESDKLYVMVKGSDWCTSCYLLDWGLEVLGYNIFDASVMRIFSPLIVTQTGAKLSKTALKNYDGSIPEWIRSANSLLQDDQNILSILRIWEQIMSHPNHLFRNYSFDEILRLVEYNRR